MSSNIYIDDLISPVLNEMQQAARDYGNTLEVALNRDSIMGEAEQKTGLSDWGSLDFVDRLDLLCDEWGRDEGLSGIGRLSLRNKLLQHASSRLLIQNEWRKHPEILDIELAAPIIVAGLPRSGTTHLLNLMATDSRLRALPLWESYEPVPLPGETPLQGAVDPRYQRCDQAWEMMQLMTPHLAAMHPMNPDHIHEELELMGPNFGSYNYEWLSHSPRWREHYYAQDQEPHYRYMRDVLKLLSWQQRDTNKPSRWVLKCPQHLEQLPALMKVFPDATVAFTHRDPVAVIQSAVTMLAYGQRMSRTTVQPQQLIEYWSARIERLLRACVRDRALVPEAKSIDIPFAALIQNEVAMVETIYAKAGLPLEDKTRREFSRFVDAKQGSHGRVAYDLAGQFGVDPDALRTKFQFYFEAFPGVG